MSKTNKSKNASTNAEQPTPSAETVEDTKTSSTSSTGDIKEDTPEVVEETITEDLHHKMVCPPCGAGYKSFKYSYESKGVYCGGCGANAVEYAQSDYWRPVVAAWISWYIPAATTAHPSTPSCDEVVGVDGGKPKKCGGQNWRHSDGKLTFCTKCGGNYKGKQPENVDDIIDSMLEQVETPSFNLQRKFSENDGRSILKARKRTE